MTFYSSIARQLPTIVFVVLGRKASHPKASNFAALGLVVLLLFGLGSATFYALAPTLVQGAGGLAVVYTLSGLVFSLFHACGVGLLVAAVMADRAAH